MAALDTRELLKLAASAEESSKHPLAVAILDKARRTGLAIPRITPKRTSSRRAASRLGSKGG